MQATPKDQILEYIEKQRAFFSTNQTKDIDFRLTQLRKLKAIILANQQKIETALWEDLHKSPEEAYLTEISLVTGEIDYHINNLKQWAKPKRVRTPLHLWPSSSKLINEPLGVSLIIAPWNYPFQLLFNPLVGSIAAGGCCLLKPSPDAPITAQVMQELIAETFDPHYVAVVKGGKATNSTLLAERFDHIFFTGSSTVGKVVMQAAANHLTPVTLELGGKSPCIVDADANIATAAKRIIWGKLINAGQTCVAPDYLFVHSSVKDELLREMVKNIRDMYGENSQQSRFYPRIVTQHAVERLSRLMVDGDLYFGGEMDIADRFIAPTILDNITADSTIMQEEIFGPILPVITINHTDEALDYINQNEKPLAFYYFGCTEKAAELVEKTTSGGACINDTLIHIGNHHLPFGGVGHSGMGQYHGKASFTTFSNQRAIVTTPTWIDLPFKYVPFKYFKWIKKII